MATNRALTNEALEARLGPPDEHQIFALYGDIAPRPPGTPPWDHLAFQGWRLARVLGEPQQGSVTEVRLYVTTYRNFVASIDAFPEKAHRPDPRAAALATKQPTLEAAAEWLTVVSRGVKLVGPEGRFRSLAGETVMRPTQHLRFDPAAAVAAVEQANRLIEEITRR